MRLHGSRRSSIRVERLNRHGDELGVLRGVGGGSLDWNNNRTIRGIGSLMVRHVEDIDWLQTRLKIVAVINDVEYPLGIYIPIVPETQYRGVGQMWEVQLRDRLHALAEGDVGTGYTIAAGTNITTLVKQQILAANEPLGAVTETTATLRGNVTMEPGATRLQVINTALEAANYFSLWADHDGQYRIEPYVDPQSRPIVHDFVDGKNAIHKSTFTARTNLFELKNKITCISRSSGDEPALWATAEITDPNNPLSITNIGERATTEEGVEIANQAAMNAHTQRRLREISDENTTITIEHAGIPHLQLNDAVRFKSADIDGRFVVQSMRMDLSRPSHMTQTTLRQVKNA